MNKVIYSILILSFVSLSVWGCESENGNDNAEGWTERDVRSEYIRSTLTKVTGPFDQPWSVGFLPDGSYLVTEKTGQLQLVEAGEITEVTGLPEIAVNGQGGLMEVLPHHSYADNGWIYITYSKPNDEGETATALIRAKIDNYELVELEELFVHNKYSSPGAHYGSRLAWYVDGTLLMSIGDRGSNPPRAQDLMDHAGTLLRLNEDGSVPDDNPFVGRDDALPEIYTYGNRNIQGLVVDPETGDIWATEHGPRGGDELNLLEAGKNYGWPTVTLGWDYRTEDRFPGSEARSKEGMEDPIVEFMPTLAPSGLAMITTNMFPAWEGNLMAGGLRAEKIMRVVPGDGEVYHMEELLVKELGRIRDVREGPDGHIYILNNAPQSNLYRMQPAN